MEFRLKTDSFSLTLKTTTYYSDIQCPSNTIMEISLDSDGFCAYTTMDIDIKTFRNFIYEINDLYKNLHGNASITEPYGDQLIQFSADKTGHIYVSGVLHNNCRNGYNQSLKFENSFDQTFLSDFINSLNNANL